MVGATKIPVDVNNRVNSILKSFGLHNALMPDTPGWLVRNVFDKDKLGLWCAQDGPTFIVDDILDCMSVDEKKALLNKIKSARLYYGYVEGDVAYEVIVPNREVRIGIPISDNDVLMEKIYRFLNKDWQ